MAPVSAAYYYMYLESQEAWARGGGDVNPFFIDDAHLPIPFSDDQ